MTNDKIVKLLTIIHDYVPAVAGSGTGVIMVYIQTWQDKLLNGMISVITSLVITLGTFFLTRYLKLKFPTKK
ncbi:hypothetical protein [Marinoscillum furvescens]|uniref:Uncharacterized protein n=1 Tax=Marinoscillum furvescens DSM 4134 TaxID=1122208 RepID=A0A3D9L6Y2_MARFU|nr:hypothetical protein [Marinoscillum furvescens]REE01108.1 hypothetical protein C7460_104128 [Marinoscillum furvescens DSM 4134]